MKKICSAKELKDAIAELEFQKEAQETELQDRMKELYERLRPVNIVKNTLQDAFSGNSKGGLLNAAIGLGSGFLSKKLVIGQSVGLLRKIIGLAVEFGVAGLVAKNVTQIKNKGSEIISRIFPKKNKPKVILYDGE